MSNGEDYRLNEMELDAIGEVMNISMGSAATAMSTMLDRKVSITTPRIEFVSVDEFNFSFLEPVIGVLIKYIEGIDGANVLLLRQADIKKIVGHLLSTDPDEMTELDEISISAICEIMNQMMGSAASALATFLGANINISPPEIMDAARQENVRELFSVRGDSLVSIRFNLTIEGLVESEFLSAMEPQLAKKIVAMSFGENEMDEAKLTAGEAPAAPQPADPAQKEVPVAVPQPAPVPEPAAPQDMLQQPMPGAAPQGAPIPPQGGMYAAAPQEQPVYRMPQHQQPQHPVQTSPFIYQSFDGEAPSADVNNLELVMSVPIQISVELGRTKKKIKDIADLGVGNIVELDRQAGDQVDVIANGRLIARGDVVVVDDNYSVRITEIIRDPEEFL